LSAFIQALVNFYGFYCNIVTNFCWHDSCCSYAPVNLLTSTLLARQGSNLAKEAINEKQKNKKEGNTMDKNKTTPSVFIIGGFLVGLAIAPSWGQSKGSDAPAPASPSSPKGDPTSPSGKSGSAAKSSDMMKDSQSGDQAAERGGRAGWNKDDVKKVQEALKDKGNDPGPADGVLGPQTQKALRAFQSAQGLKSTGRLDSETAKALGIEHGSSSMSSPSSSKTPSSSSQESAPMGTGSSSSTGKNKEPVAK
jgi:putative peptidoglycan binding protein